MGDGGDGMTDSFAVQLLNLSPPGLNLGSFGEGGRNHEFTSCQVLKAGHGRNDGGNRINDSWAQPTY
jgi:hypothetical protein